MRFEHFDPASPVAPWRPFTAPSSVGGAMRPWRQAKLYPGVGGALGVEHLPPAVREVLSLLFGAGRGAA